MAVAHNRRSDLATLTSLTEEARITLDTISDRTASLLSPALRLGVTGLSRSGKTVFISSLIHNLVHGGRLPMFEPSQSGRIASAFLEPQPDDGVPRFQYEDHIVSLIEKRIWPQSTRSISELRLTLHYESASAWNRMFSGGKLSIDIVDYPGEWLLDLPLLGKSFSQFSNDAFELSSLPGRSELAAEWHSLANDADPDAEADETFARRLAEAFTRYLRACKEEERALATLPPGRFLMPGDLEGSPALTFAPLSGAPPSPRPGSLAAMMERRYEAYKSLVVRPFFRQHVARLDRQIVLVDALQALNAGRASVADLERALGEILSCFRPGSANLFTSFVTRRIDRILIAATKADHLHHEGHDKLQAIVRQIVDRAIERADFSGANVDVIAMAAVRATREGSVKHGGETLPVIIGTPLAGESIDGETYDGTAEAAVFPGDLPASPQALFGKPPPLSSKEDSLVRFVRFRPPKLESDERGITLSLPHIRLDRALQFLVGDRLA
jgi:predicted YcjX-like family ATPase